VTTPTTGIRLVFTAFTARATRNVNGFTKSIDRARVAAGLFVVGLAARNLAQSADQFSNITNQVRVTASATEDVAASTGEVFRIAQRSRAAIDATARTYTRLKRVGGEFGATQAQVLVATEAIQKSFQVGGVSAKEAAGSALQLSQALGSGKLAGDELRAILEGNQVLSKAIADEFGVGVGQLKLLGERGKLVSATVFKSILEAAGQINEDFAKLTPTFSQSATILKNSFIVAIGQINQAFDLSGKFFSLASTVSDSFIDGAENAIIAWGEFEKFIIKSKARLGVEVDQLQDDVVNVFDGVAGEGAFDAAIEQAKELGTRTAGFVKNLFRAAAGTGAGSGPLVKTKTDLEEAEAAAVSFGTTFLANREAEKTAKLDAALVGVKARFEEINKRSAAATENADKLRNGLRQLLEAPVSTEVSGGVVGQTATKIEDLSEFALQAARNMQSAFADFLFDPFDEGIKGMLRGFVDIIRRMIAEALAARLLESLFGNQNAVNKSGKEVAGSGFAKAIGGLFGFRDGGGFTVGGSGGPDSKLAAFRVSPGERVSITKPNQSAGGAITIVNNVNVSGNGVTMAEVNAAVAQGNQSTMANLADIRRRGRG